MTWWLLSLLLQFPIIAPADYTIPITNKYSDCSDLVIDTVYVIKEKRKYVEVEFLLKNLGQSNVQLGGVKRGFSDDVAIQAHFSGDTKLNKGDLLAGGVYMGKLGKQLSQGEAIKGNMKIRLKRKTNYINVLILKADATQRLVECDEGNNTAHTILRY